MSELHPARNFERNSHSHAPQAGENSAAATKPSSANSGAGDAPFVARHLGPDAEETAAMLNFLGYDSLAALTFDVVPDGIRTPEALRLSPAATEQVALAELRTFAKQNELWKSYLGTGYADCIVPAVIQRNILENPGWYTQYTPYQAEVAQGRLEALLNFQTMIVDLTAMEIANASLLDEGTAAAEAMAMCYALAPTIEGAAFFISDRCHPQTIAVVQQRAEPIGVKVIVGDADHWQASEAIFGMLLQYPATDGSVQDYEALIQRVHAAKALAVVATDLLSLTLLKAPGEMGADIVVGNSQRFGVPLGFGGPHAAFLATRDEYKRRIPGRMVGVSKDSEGRPAIRLVLQTREQHIRRDKATSNICTAQVLLAVMAGMYAVYHGPEGLRRIGEDTHERACTLAEGLRRLGYAKTATAFFDTVRVELDSARRESVLAAARAARINLRTLTNAVVVALDEATAWEDVEALLKVFALGQAVPALEKLRAVFVSAIPSELLRQSAYLTHPTFHRYRSETKMLRYIRSLEGKDLSLTTSMIPLGSCTMKLNATSELLPISWPEFNRIHPFVPKEQVTGYRAFLKSLEAMLEEITGFDGVSLQPNSGAQGEYAGLLVVRKYLQSLGQGDRNVCLIPESAHGTNPASAVMAGFRVVVVKCDSGGNVDLADLRAKAKAHGPQLAALMVTYPSTHGVFEEGIREFCEIIHGEGGQVYMDGANLNAQVGLCRPGTFGPDVCHLNLHKTFCIPHGGGGPGMGPIAVKAHLVPFLPGHPLTDIGGKEAIGPVSAAPWGSASILPISWMYIRMMGGAGLKQATQIAILNANYIAKRLDGYFPVVYRGGKGLVAHECIIDLREAKRKAGVEVEDIAKRLIDYGFHAPTVSWPVAGTMMIEPTESEGKEEMDRFCDALIAIHSEIRAIEEGKAPRENNVLKNAPHTAERVMADQWPYSYSREVAAFPAPWTRARKFWPAVGRIDNVWGDRNLFCSCPPVEDSSHA